MFACITRTGSFDKELECHGFICKSTEEAVSVAAQLYQALLETMKTQGNHKKVHLRTQLLILSVSKFAASVSIIGKDWYHYSTDSQEPALYLWDLSLLLTSQQTRRSLWRPKNYHSDLFEEKQRLLAAAVAAAAKWALPALVIPLPAALLQAEAENCQWSVRNLLISSWVVVKRLK